MAESNRIPVLAANWKMHKTTKEALAFLDAFIPMTQGVEGRQIVIAPSFVSLEAVSTRCQDSVVEVAAQNMFHREQGAFTGEVSPLMIRGAGAGWVILGHSERRHIFGEDDELIGKKVKSAVDHGLNLFLCIGETLEERDAGRIEEVLSRQLEKGLALVSGNDYSKIVIAYEPVWAIGTGRTATLEQISQAHRFVRELIAEQVSSTVAQEIRILYGGSVKPANVGDIMSLQDVDGALVGGASLEPDSFIQIVKYEGNG
jgi:triosephosphate isomerase